MKNTHINIRKVAHATLWLQGCLAVCMFLFFPSVWLSAAERESVGLVLSGGGAKGIAHVGVIKALEDNNIPIDYVTGTSMGAIVGSFYSMGWTPEQMMQLFTSKDFGYWSTGRINPDRQYYISRPDLTPQWISLNINFRDTTRSITSQILPANLISPIPMNIEFLEPYAPYTLQCRENFNNLFVPFRCVTSDVYHKRKIVLSKGSLGDAVRASMSFPFVFKPITMDGVLVYDGGIYDNFPVDVMEEDFNPDFIIGVSVSGPDSKPLPGEVYSQLEDMIIQNNNYRVPSDKGIKIQVPVLNFGVLDFDKARTIYDIGYRTGLSMVDSIKERVSARRDLAEVNARRKTFRDATSDVEFDSLRITGATPYQSAYLRYVFDPVKNRPFNLGEVENSYYRAIDGGKLNDLLPQAEFSSDGHNTLLLKASVKRPWHFGVGGWITSSTNSQLYLNVGYHTLGLNSLDLDVGGWIGQSYYAGMASARFALRSRIPSYLRADFVVSRQKYYDTELLFYQTRSPQFITDREVFFRLMYSMALGRKGKGYASLGYGWIKDSYYPDGVIDYASVRKDYTNYRTLVLRLGVEGNTLNDNMYPSKGGLFRGEAKLSYESSVHVPQGIKAEGDRYKSYPVAGVSLEWKRYLPLHKNISLGLNFEGMGGFMKIDRNYTSVMVHSPAFAPTPATRNYYNPAFRSPSYVAAGLSPVWSPIQNFQIRGDFYAYSSVRNIRRGANGNAVYDGWFRKAEFIGEAAAVYNFSFASISLYCNYLSYPAHNWNFGINFGLLYQAPKL